MTYSAQPTRIVHNTTTPPPPAPPPPPQFRALEGSVRELRQHHVPRLADLCRAKVDLRSALRDACETRDFELIKRLIECSANPNTFVSDPFDPTAGTIPILACACILGKADLVECLLRHGASPALWMMVGALKEGHEDVVQIMSQHVTIDTLDHRTGMSLLHRACFEADPARVAWLISHGADVKLTSNAGTPPLILAFRDGNADLNDQLKVMGILLDAGADIEAPNSDGHTPLSVACDLNELEVVSLLLRRGANPNAELPDELTPFKICCFGQTALPIFTKVLEHGGKLPTGVALRLIGRGRDETSCAKREQLMTAFVTEGHWPTGLRQFRS